MGINLNITEKPHTMPHEAIKSGFKYELETQKEER